MRYFSGFLVASILIAACSMSYAELEDSRPSAGIIRAATAACAPTSVKPQNEVVGISDPHTLDAGVIKLIAETGVKWVRAEFHWSRIEPTGQGNYRWEPYDTMVEGFTAAGIQVLGILTYIPEHLLRDWGQIDAAFQRFAVATVRRYAPRGVHYWEAFNEPNLTGYGWLTKRQEPQDYLGAYTLLLARVNQAVRENDPNGIVVLGGIASDQHRGLPVEYTMEVLYDLGAKDCFDVFAYHPYGYQSRFGEARARVDAVLGKAGDLGKPIWFNEYGWTDYKAMDLSRNDNARTNPMIAAFSQRGAADALFWFSAKDYSAKLGTPTFGLATFDLEKRPSFTTFQRLMEVIN
jgi:hypothetical protein